MTAENPLNVLVGEQLAGVHFVMDYVELYFGGPIVRAHSFPTIVANETAITFPDQGSRDALCSLIGDVISEIVESKEDVMEFRFASGRKIWGVSP